MKNQEKLLELQLINQEVEQINQTVNVLASQVNELNIVKDSISEIEKEKIGTEILTPLGAGIFLRSKLLDNKKLIVNVGAKVTKTKSVKETKLLIENQINELEREVNKLGKALEQLIEKQGILYSEIEKK